MSSPTKMKVVREVFCSDCGGEHRANFWFATIWLLSRQVTIHPMHGFLLESQKDEDDGISTTLHVSEGSPCLG